jgi:hypothetical protein
LHVDFTASATVLCAGGLLSASAPLLVLPPSAAAAVEELQQFSAAAAAGGGDWDAAGLLRCLGFVLDAAQMHALDSPKCLASPADAGQAAALGRVNRLARQLASRLAGDLACPGAAALLDAARELGGPATRGTAAACLQTVQATPQEAVLQRSASLPDDHRRQITVPRRASGRMLTSGVAPTAALLFAALKGSRAGIGLAPEHPLQACRVTAVGSTLSPLLHGMRAGSACCLSVP